MKKILDTILRIILIVVFLLPYILNPIDVIAAYKLTDNTTIKDMNKELENLKAEKVRQQNEKKLTQSQYNSKTSESAAAHKEKEEIIVKVEEAEAAIIESEKEIDRVTEEINELMKFMQVSDGGNVYLNYILSSSNITDLLVKTAAVEQLTKNNEDIIDRQKAAIKNNEDLKEELRLRNIELDDKIEELRKKISSLGSRLKELSEMADDIDTEIKNLNEYIKYYKSICKSEDQKISTCSSIIASTGWMRPLSKGRITSPFGYRTNPITGAINSFHEAIDIGGNPEGTNVYATAYGEVAAVNYRMSCGGNRVFIHVKIKDTIYTVLYVHLLSYSVKVGDKVTVDTVIGKVGGGAQTKGWETCSTGAHLHYSISKGRHTSVSSSFLANAVNPPGYPGAGVWFYSRI